MRRHLIANLWLIGLSLLLCCVVYPLTLFAVGQVAFRHSAEGSLLDANGRPTTDAAKAAGSRLIGQPFTKDEFFWPRPSATSPFAYNAAASGASNYGASNPLLRDRVARALGPIATYKDGKPVAPDIETWFQKDQYQGKPGIVAQWAKTYPALAQNWVKGDKLNAEYVTAWQKAHSAEVALWVKENPGTPEPAPADLAVPFFVSYSSRFPGTFPVAVEHKTTDGVVEKRIEPVKEGGDIQGIFFEMWLQAHPHAELREVPADMVMASGSGLDPHITLENARYQLDRVAAAWTAKTKADPKRIREEIERVLDEKKEAPLGGLVGVPLVNVLEVNLALANHMPKLAR